ncbi:MAG TPA: hypothetical protein VFS84_13515, partial [Candidatus Binatia bacterium]|nr:hypothetical protein [Candidatus Binatia bacterium]
IVNFVKHSVVLAHELSSSAKTTCFIDKIPDRLSRTKLSPLIPKIHVSPGEIVRDESISRGVASRFEVVVPTNIERLKDCNRLSSGRSDVMVRYDATAQKPGGIRHGP